MSASAGREILQHLRWGARLAKGANTSSLRALLLRVTQLLSTPQKNPMHDRGLPPPLVAPKGLEGFDPAMAGGRHWRPPSPVRIRECEETLYKTTVSK